MVAEETGASKATVLKILKDAGAEIRPTGAPNAKLRSRWCRTADADLAGDRFLSRRWRFRRVGQPNGVFVPCDPAHAPMPWRDTTGEGARRRHGAR